MKKGIVFPDEQYAVAICFRGDSSISQMPGCGPNALPKNWI